MHSPLEVSAASEVADVVERVQKVGVGVYLPCLVVQHLVHYTQRMRTHMCRFQSKYLTEMWISF